MIDEDLQQGLFYLSSSDTVRWRDCLVDLQNTMVARRDSRASVASHGFATRRTGQGIDGQVGG